MTASIVLHQWHASPFCRKVGHMLNHKGLAFDVVNYNGLRGMMALRLSKVGKLPVLDIQGQRVQDSTRIARFLDQHYPAKPVYPADPIERAQAELWEDWADEVLYFFEGHFRINDPVAMKDFVALICADRPTWERIPMKFTLKFGGNVMLKGQGLGRMAKADIHAEFFRHMDRIDLVLAQTGWLVGDTKTIADIAVSAQLLEFVRTSPMRCELLRRKHLATWLDKLKPFHG